MLGRQSGAMMAGRFGLVHKRERDLDGGPTPRVAVRKRDDCVAQLLAAVHDIADFDDIHQAAERLNAIQAWIRREARAAAADPIFDDEASAAFHVSPFIA
jgi:hypothetical protein